MKINRIIFVICVSIVALAAWNNVRYSRTLQRDERVEKLWDSICVMQYENLLHGIQTSTQVVESLSRERKSVDSVYLQNQKQLLQQMELLIKIDRQILKQYKNQRCSISSTIHTVE